MNKYYRISLYMDKTLSVSHKLMLINGGSIRGYKLQDKTVSRQYSVRIMQTDVDKRQIFQLIRITGEDCLSIILCRYYIIWCMPDQSVDKYHRIILFIVNSLAVSQTLIYIKGRAISGYVLWDRPVYHQYSLLITQADADKRRIHQWKRIRGYACLSPIITGANVDKRRIH